MKSYQQEFIDEKGRVLLWEINEVLVAQQSQLQELFLKHDINKDGRLNFKEFRALVSTIHPDFPNDSIQCLFYALDPELKGQMKLENFEAALKAVDRLKDRPGGSADEKCPTKEKEAQRNKAIEQIDLKLILIKEKHDKKQLNIAETINTFDVNKKGYLDRDAFCLMIESCLSHKDFDLSHEERQYIFEVFDPNNKNKIQTNRFLTYMGLEELYSQVALYQSKKGFTPNPDRNPRNNNYPHHHQNQITPQNYIPNNPQVLPIYPNQYPYPQYPQYNPHGPIPQYYPQNQPYYYNQFQGNYQPPNVQFNNYPPGYPYNNHQIPQPQPNYIPPVPQSPPKLQKEEQKNDLNKFLPPPPNLMDVEIYQPPPQTYNLDDFYDVEPGLKGFQKFDSIFTELQINKMNFIDDSFPPDQKSLFEGPKSRGNYVWRDLVWLRPQDFFGGRIAVFQKVQTMVSSRIGMGQLISPYDIQQGHLGDCYFLSSLSSMADVPERILNLFITKKYNDIGIYCIKINHNGEWIAVFVDDYFPCINKIYGPAFTKANGNEIWVLLLQQVWAKLFGSYERIEAGYCRDALRDLTGAPTKHLSTTDSQIDLWTELKSAFSDENKYILTAGTQGQQDLTKSQQERVGLIAAHAYSLIGCFEVDHPIRGKTQLLQLRNPWGQREWKGQWSDDWDEWTSELKKKLGIKNKNDGVFFMNIKDFQNYFSDIAVCYYHDNYSYVSHRVTTSWRHAAYVLMKVVAPGIYYITINQQNKRLYQREENYNYSQAQIWIGKKQGKKFSFCTATHETDQETWVADFLQPGEYIIYSQVFWKNGRKEDTFVLSSYGPFDVQFQTLSQKEDGLLDFVQTLLMDRAFKGGKFQPYTSLHQPLISKAVEMFIEQGFGSFVSIDVTFQFNDFQGLKLRQPHRGSVLNLFVPPNTDGIACFTIGKTGFSYSYTQSMRLV